MVFGQKDHHTIYLPQNAEKQTGLVITILGMGLVDFQIHITGLYQI